MPIDLTDRLDQATRAARVEGAIQAPPTLGAAPYARSEPAGTLTGPAGGLTVDPSSSKPPAAAASSASTPSPAVPAASTGRDASGVITAESAQAAYGNDMQRSGGVFGTMDLKGVNEIMARENKARGEMIDSMIKVNGGNGVAVLPDPRAQPASQGLSFSDIQSAMKSAGTRTERAAYGQMLNTMLNNQVQMRGQDINYGAEMARLGITTRGQDTGAVSAQAEQEALNQRNADRVAAMQRGQDLNASTAANRIASQQSIAQAKIDEQIGRNGLSLPQQRSNTEIDAARSRVAGLDPNEIKRRTANFTATGRENPDYDPTLAKAVSQANRRKYGADDVFDQRQQAPQPAGTDGDVMTRFRADQAMQGHKTGQVTDRGIEVFDASGKLIGHYR